MKFSLYFFTIIYALKSLKFSLNSFRLEAGRGAAARGVTAKPTGCGFDLHSRRWNIYLNLYFHFFALVSRLSAALSSATRHAMPPEFGRKRGKECLNTRFPLPTLLCAGYSVKLFFFNFLKEMEIYNCLLISDIYVKDNLVYIEVSQGAGAVTVNATGCGVDSRSGRWAY